jgi:ABC-type spermidine/putrescine transport system permease subunit II
MHLIQLFIFLSSSEVLFSFNSSNIITSWESFSFHWYAKLWQDKEIIKADKNEIKNATQCVV